MNGIPNLGYAQPITLNAGVISFSLQEMMSI